MKIVKFLEDSVINEEYYKKNDMYFFSNFMIKYMKRINLNIDIYDIGHIQYSQNKLSIIETINKLKKYNEDQIDKILKINEQISNLNNIYKESLNNKKMGDIIMETGVIFGIFDFLNITDVLFFKQIKEKYDRVIIVLQKESYTNQTFKDRLAMLESIKYIDEILIFKDESEISDVIKRLKLKTGMTQSKMLLFCDENNQSDALNKQNASIYKRNQQNK